MRRLLVIGWLLGSITFGCGVLVGANWYDYRLATTVTEPRDLVNAHGWEVVPGQANATYLRRARLHLP